MPDEEFYQFDDADKDKAVSAPLEAEAEAVEVEAEVDSEAETESRADQARRANKGVADPDPERTKAREYEDAAAHVDVEPTAEVGARIVLDLFDTFEGPSRLSADEAAAVAEFRKEVDAADAEDAEDEVYVEPDEDA